MNKLSVLVKHQLPEFISSDYEMFVAFLQAYYRFTEEEGGSTWFISNYNESLDVDLASDEFIKEYVAEFANTIPKNILIDKPTLLKYIREFYLSKGSEDSFRFLMTILHNTNIEVFYPRDYMQRTSNGKWQSDESCYITGNNFNKLVIDNQNLNAIVTGLTSGNELVIDSITTAFENNGQRVLKLNISSYNGTLIVGEEVELTIDATTVSETAVGLINTINVTNGGTDYALGDILTITGDGIRAKARISKLGQGGYNDVPNIVNGGANYSVGDPIRAAKALNDDGHGFTAVVQTVDVNGAITGIRVLSAGYDYSVKSYASVKSNSGGNSAVIELNGSNIGKIEAVEVVESGYGYTTTPTITIDTDTGDGNATFTCEPETLFVSPSYYANQDDWLDNYSKIQDSNYYQQYSYVIKTSVSPSLWKDVFKRIAHPAGTVLFGMYTLESEAEALSTVPVRQGNVINRQLYLSSVINTTVETTAPSLARFMTVLEAQDVCGIGYKLNELDHMKFLDSFGYVVGDFLQNTLSDVTEYCMPESTLVESATITIE